MKKNTFTLIVFLLLGLVAGTLIGNLLAQVPVLSFLTKTVDLEWKPRADLIVLKYDLQLYIKLNLIGLIGIALAFWLYRKV